MKLGNPDALWLLLFLPALGGFFLWAFRSRRAALGSFASHDLLAHLLRAVSVRRQVFKMFLLLLGAAFLVMALIEPKWGFHWEEIKRRGLDIVVALDVSKSMMAEDIAPNRLEAAKREIKSLVNNLHGDRIGIVAFAGTSFLNCPLTLDYSTAKLFLNDLEPEAVPLGGTDIGGAIRTALEAFEGHEKKHRVLILITDGEDHRDRVMAAAEEAKRKGVVIFPIGIGRREGAPIPVFDEAGRKGFVKDRNGQVVLSKRDDVLLGKLALLTGGKKGSIGAGRFPLEEIYEEEIARMEKKELESSRQKRYEHRFQIFLFMALICFVFEGIMSERKTVKATI